MAGSGGEPVTLHGAVLPGFEGGGDFVALPTGANGTSAWEASDFSTAVRTLRLLGFNAVLLPFTFDGLAAAPADAAQPCAGGPPSDTQLAARIGAVAPAPGALAPPPKLAKLVNATPGTCNGYVPSGPTVLARLLWTAEYVVRSGMYVALEYRPPHRTGNSGDAPAELDGPEAFAAAWLQPSTVTAPAADL